MMQFNTWFDLYSTNPSLKNKEKMLSFNQYLNIYIVFRILEKMKREVGLGAMLQYLNKYINTFESNYPRNKTSVSEILDFVDIEEMYKESVDNNMNRNE